MTSALCESSAPAGRPPKAAVYSIRTDSLSLTGMPACRDGVPAAWGRVPAAWGGASAAGGAGSASAIIAS